MNREELRKQFELAALGCLENEQYIQFFQAISEDEELKTEFGQYQKVASLLPFSLDIQQPPAEIKNKVAIGIKKIIQNRLKETKPASKPSAEENTESTIEQNIIGKTDELIPAESVEEDNSPFDNPTEILSDTIEEETFQTEEILDSNIQEISTQEDVNNQSLPNPDIKVNIDYSSTFKEEIIDEVTKRVKKTIQIQFEDFENKLSKKNKTIKFLLILITLLTLLLIGFNVYRMILVPEKKVEVNTIIKSPATEIPDSLQK